MLKSEEFQLTNNFFLLPFRILEKNIYILVENI